MIRAGIIGGAGYTAGELLRLLVNHPDVEISWIHSTSNAGNPVTSVHQGLIGEIDMKFSSNPGCFATAIQLALLPLAKNLMLNSTIHVTAITGSTGAGVKPSATSHYSWRNDNVSIYKPFRHQHLAEIRQSLSQLQQSFKADIDFIPVRGCFSRGIMAILYLDCPVSLDQIKKLYEEYYDDHNFTFITDKAPDLKDVVNTNKCIIHLEKVDNKLLITSVIDNLVKGASGQAVHNMNLLFGLHERIGLQLKPSAF